ncbi:Hypothetical protein A7982_01935 [Minicystis rosea]|nr:Hypothetical protein A7982_01935 [Minicystis rosea]
MFSQRRAASSSCATAELGERDGRRDALVGGCAERASPVC